MFILVNTGCRYNVVNIDAAIVQVLEEGEGGVLFTQRHIENFDLVLDYKLGRTYTTNSDFNKHVCLHE